MFYAMGKSDASNTKNVEENFNISISGAVNSQFVNFIKQEENIKLNESENLEEDVKEGKLLLALEVPDNIDDLIKEEKQAGVNIIYDNSSQQSMMAQGIIEKYIQSYSNQVVSERLKERNIDTTILTPVKIDYKTTSKEEEGFAKILISMILPLLLVMYSVMGPMGSAVDLGAGEKERGTLEPLLTTQAGRMSLLWGKFGAISVIGLLTTLASLLGLVISFNMNSNSMGGMELKASSMLGLSAGAIAVIFIMVVLLNLIFGSIELAVSIYARSFKEAQTYLSPLIVVAIMPMYLTYMLDARNINTFYFHIPVANVMCIMKEILAGVFNTGHILITFAWVIVYIVAAISFARYMFSREEVIFRT
jgi:sodium transport system permease protein